MAEAGLALVNKVRIRMGGRAHGFFELVAFTSDSMSSKTTNGVAEELCVAKRFGSVAAAVASRIAS